MKFDFTDLDTFNIKPEAERLKILCDGMPYKETIRTRVGRLSFQNENGQVTLIGQFNIGKIDLNNAVVISPLKVEFSNDLRSSLEMTFNEPIIDIVFNIDSEMYNHISENFNYFRKYKGELLGNTFKVKLNKIENFDIDKIIPEYYKDDDVDMGLKAELKLSGDDGKNLTILNDGKMRMIDERQNDIISESEHHMILNDEEMSTSNMKTKNTFELNNDFIAFNDDETQAEELIKKSFANSTHSLVNSVKIPPPPSKNKLINYKFNHSMTFNMNSLGYYIKRKNIEGDTVRENTSFKLKQSLLSPNSDLFSNTEGTLFSNYYTEATIINFFKVFINAYTEKHDKMDIDDNQNTITKNTKIVIDYLGKLENEKSDFEKKIMNFDDEDAIGKLKHKLQQEILTIKLFKILFLNCFTSFSIDSDNTGNKYDHLFTNNTDEKIKKYRKKKLIEWLIEYNQESFRQIMSTMKTSDNYTEKIKVCLMNGQLQEATNIALHNKDSFLALMISQTNNIVTQSTMANSLNFNYGRLSFSNTLKDIYSLFSNKASNILTSKYSTWTNTLLQLLMFKSSPSSSIADSLTNEVNCDPKKNINYSLIKLYGAIEKKDVNTQKQMLEALSYAIGGTDHHIQYIISMILKDVIHELYPSLDQSLVDKSIEVQTLKQLNMFLLPKTIEEVLIGSNNPNGECYENLLRFLDLVHIPKRVKRNMLIDVFSRIDLSNKNEADIKTMCTDESIGLSSLGLYYKYIKDYDQAIEYFTKGNAHIMAAELYVSQCIDKIVNDKSEFKPDKVVADMTQLSRQGFDGFTGLFYSYACVMCKDYQINIEFISDLIQKILALEKGEYQTEAAKGIMITDLREIMKNGLYKKDLLLIANSSILQNNCVPYSSKIREINDTLKSIILNRDKCFKKN